MRPRRSTLIVLIAISFASVAVGLALWNHFKLIYPTPETKSSFLKSYTPQPVIDRFRDLSEGFSYGQHQSSGAGRNSVGESSGFAFYIVLSHDRWMPLMDALEADALKQFANCGARIVSRTGDSHNGFHFEYTINKSVGSLTILPLAPTSPAPVRNMSLPDGMEDVTVRTEQMETWFPNGTQTRPANAL